ncbi:hypothetical protein ES708_28456 [subsurface metagenome]
MTANTVSAKLDAILDPLNSISEQANAALDLAQQNKLPAPFIRTIRDAINRLDAAHDELLEIATALDPTLSEPEP